jgi:nicotinate-nucleotide adenylyltransferase
MKQNIAIFGGAFNPITNGHIQSAKFVLDNLKEIEEVWLSPCYQHTYGKDMAPSKHRMEMCKISTDTDPRIFVFPYQITHRLSGSTYEFFLDLHQRYSIFKDIEFHFIIGLDNALTLDRWVNPEALKKEAPFIVIPRPGYSTESHDEWFMKSPHIFLDIPHPIMEVSSTEIRDLLIAGKFEEASKKVPARVINYIIENNLYI